MNDIKKTTLIRILSAIIALPVYVFTIVTDLLQAIPILISSLTISLVSLYEYYKTTDKGNEGKAFVGAGMVIAVVINLIIYLFAYGEMYGYSKFLAAFDARVILGALALFITFILILQVFKRPIKGGSYSLGVTLFGLIYIVFSFSHIILMKSLTNGIYYIIILNIVIMLNDSGAYFGGVLFGRHKTNFAVSPNKSWEGYFSGLLFSILAMTITNQVYISFFDKRLFGIVEAIILGIALSIIGSTGDLVESAIKRDGSIKDSGSIIPGHGGMWDTFDALIFTFPLFYYYLILKGIT